MRQTESEKATPGADGFETRLPQKKIFFLLMHVACAAAIWTGVSLSAVLLCVGLYYVRMFGLSAGYHRYFAHRSFRTGRVFQFALALIGCSAVQKGPLWWAAHHRRHHRFTDREGDIHSPRQNGFWWAHVGWVLSRKYDATDYEAIGDFARFPELRWLNRWHLLPPVALAGGLYLLGGWQWLVWGFVVSTVVLYHGTFSVNSLAHMWGKRRYETTDDSRNNLWLALITCGEGWHNNHHRYMASVKQGFFWWEVDLSYYVLLLLSRLKIIWSLRAPPDHLVASAEA